MLPGTKQYWYSRYLELKALLEQGGFPTFFWTVSSADNYWPQLRSLMPSSSGSNESQTHATRVKSVIDNPHITDWFFHAKLTDFIKHWLHDTLDADWYWYRYEYQARGSTHAHGYVLSLKMILACANWYQQQNKRKASSKQQHIIHYGKHAKYKAIRYIDWLVSTINPDIPDDSWRTPNPHPCTQGFSDIPSSSLDTDYHSLLNCVQRHTRCNAAYCLRRRGTNQEAVCRFGYPKECSAVTSITFENLPNGHIKATLSTARDDPRVNSHNRIMLQHWRANVDLQIIVDFSACARYMTKYVSKSEPRSKVATEIFNNCTRQLTTSSDTATTFRRCMIQSVGERDFSAQETAHLLLSLPLYSCTYKFVTLSLEGSRQVSTDSDSNKLATHASTLDTYSKRYRYSDEYPNITKISLLEFASQFVVKKEEISPRSHSVVVQTFPTFSSDPKGAAHKI